MGEAHPKRPSSDMAEPAPETLTEVAEIVRQLIDRVVLEAAGRRRDEGGMKAGAVRRFGCANELGRRRAPDNKRPGLSGPGVCLSGLGCGDLNCLDLLISATLN